MSYDISKLPGVMRANSWPKGAALMDAWFARPPNDKPESVTPDTTTITMSWALGFARAKRVYDTMILERIWSNAAAQRQIAKMLRDQGKLMGQEVSFGDLRQDVARIDRDYIQFRAVGSLTDPVDDMFAALGRFTFRVAISGKVVPRSGRHQVQIEQIGIYIRDSYDFNGDQSLGYWSATGFAGGWNPIGGTEVTNADFRAWRTAHGKGGDYMVFSDVRILQGNDRDKFEV